MTRALSLVNRRFLSNLEKCKKHKLLSLYNKQSKRTIVTCSSTSSTYSPLASTSNELEDESLWVNSSIQDVKPVVGYTLPEFIRENQGKWGHEIAFESYDGKVKYTHNQVLQQSRGFAAALKQAGFKRNDTIGVVLHNIPEYCSVLFGIWEAGLIASPVNPSYTAAEIRRQLKSSGSKAVITIPDYLEAACSAKETNPDIKCIIIIGEPHEGCHTYYEMVKADTRGVDFQRGSQMDTVNDTVLLPYSSGTTGNPKGVMLTHTNLTTNLLQASHDSVIRLKDYGQTGEQEKFIGLLPFFHSYGLACIMTLTMFRGGYTMTLPKFDTKTFVNAFRTHKPSFCHLVTPLINYIVNSEDFGPKELESLHGVCGGAAPIGPALISQLLDKAGRYLLFQEGYGMTELSPVSHLLPPWTNNQKVGSCGAPVPSTSTKIICTKTGKTLNRFERGEICVKGPQVMKGYFNNEEATRSTIDPAGWLHTGDIGYYDNDDCLFIVDRLKELIKVKGFQVAPSELEDLLRSHDKVEDVAVIGVPDAESGELPRAYIVKKKRSNLEADELHHFLKDQVTSFKQLKGGIEFIDAIPKAPTGKILRRELLTDYKKQRGLD